MTGAGAQIGLGGAQFGLDYGVTNRSGRVPRTELDGILTTAAARGVAFIDTAPGYGKSEAAIGCFAGARDFRIVTKTPKFAAAQTAADAAGMLRQALQASLERLRVPAVDGLLVHDADDLLGHHGDAIWATLEAVRAEGLARRIGVSVYDGAAIDLVLARFPPDIVQLPYNMLDDRLEQGGQFERLAHAGVAIHARSIFLQGLLLAAPDQIPLRFGPLAEAVAEFRSWAGVHGLSPLAAALTRPLRRAGIEACILGVTSLAELENALEAASRVAALGADIAFTRKVPLAESHLDPSRWHEL